MGNCLKNMVVKTLVTHTVITADWKSKIAAKMAESIQTLSGLI